MYLLLDSPTLNNITDPCSFLFLLVLCPFLVHLVVLFINDTLCVHFLNYQLCCSSVTKSLGPHGLQHARPSVLHYLPEFAQIHALWVSDAIQPSNLLLSSSPFAFNISQHQCLVVFGFSSSCFIYK